MPRARYGLLNLKPGELPLAAMSALFFFLVLFGYFLLRPLREAMGVARGLDDLRWLFAVTALVSLVVVVVFGGVVARLDRRRFIPLGYLFVVACLLVFATLLVQDVRAGGGFIGTGIETDMARRVGYTYYVWLSVVNLFLTSVFWAFMVDIYDVDQGKRMFAFIGIGGTLGAFAGGVVAREIGARIEHPYMPAGLMMLGAGMFLLAIAVMLTLDKMAERSRATSMGRQPSGRDADSPPVSTSDPGSDELGASAARAIGGSAWEGARAVLSSPYLLGVGLWVVFMTISSTLLYFTQAEIVLEESDSFIQLVANFAEIDLVSQGATLFTQVFVTTHVIRKMGVGWTLAILPVMTMAGFAVLAVWPVYGALVVFQAVHRATRHAVARPSRETLFSVVTPAEKYKAKPIIDVFLYRGGDLAGAGVVSLFALVGIGIAGVALSTVPLAAMWIALSVGMGRAQSRRMAG